MNVLTHYCISVFITIPNFFSDREEAYPKHSAIYSPLHWLFIFFATFFAWNVVYNLRLTVSSSKYSVILKPESTYSLVSDRNFKSTGTDSSFHNQYFDPHPRQLHQEPEHGSSRLLRQKQQRQPLPSWCGVCHQEKPFRAHHCKICGLCVAKRDHHCYVLGQCIGLNNQGHFILFLLHAGLSLIFSSILLVIHANRQFLEALSFFDVAIGLYYLFPLNLFRWIFLRDFPFYLILISILLGASFLNAVICSAYGLFQFFLVLRDDTWFEFRSGGRKKFSIRDALEAGGISELELGGKTEEGVSVAPRKNPARSLRQCFGRRWFFVPFFPFLLNSFSSRGTRIKEV